MFKKSEFDRDDSAYQDLCEKLRPMQTKVLIINIPGTGCSKDAILPTTQAAQDLAGEYELPVLFLEGVGLLNKDPNAIHPVQTNPNKLTPTKKSWWDRILSFGASDAESIVGISEIGAVVGGVVLGSGEINHNRRILNVLRALQRDELLPHEIIFLGHSRGAVNCISMSNTIYIEYGNLINFHFCLTDPVPGPFHEKDIYQKIIPPSTISFTCVYAPDEANSLYIANDITKLLFINPRTIISTFANPNTDHVSVLDQRVYNITLLIISSINNLPISVSGETFSSENRLSSRPAQGKGARKNSQFTCYSSVNTNRDYLRLAINLIRRDFDDTYEIFPSGTEAFYCPEISDEQTRRELLTSNYETYLQRKEATIKPALSSNNNSRLELCSISSPVSFFSPSEAPPSLRSSNNSQPTEERPLYVGSLDIAHYLNVQEIKKGIFLEAKIQPQGGYNCLSYDKGKSYYVTEQQKKILNIIEQAERNVGNILAPEWEAVLDSCTREKISASLTLRS